MHISDRLVLALLCGLLCGSSSSVVIVLVLVQLSHVLMLYLQERYIVLLYILIF